MIRKVGLQNPGPTATCSLCICVCKCKCVNICLYIYIYTCVCMCVCWEGVYVCTCMHVCIHAHVCERMLRKDTHNLHTHIPVCIYTVYMCAQECIHTYIPTYIHTCIHYLHARTHTHTHTHTRTTHTCRHTCVHAHMHACMHTHLHIRSHTGMHACKHTSIHSCIHTFICTALTKLTSPKSECGGQHFASTQKDDCAQHTRVQRWTWRENFVAFALALVVVVLVRQHSVRSSCRKWRISSVARSGKARPDFPMMSVK